MPMRSRVLEWKRPHPPDVSIRYWMLVLSAKTSINTQAKLYFYAFYVVF